jgi:hypothetical protein
VLFVVSALWLRPEAALGPLWLKTTWIHACRQ